MSPQIPASILEELRHICRQIQSTPALAASLQQALIPLLQQYYRTYNQWPASDHIAAIAENFSNDEPHVQLLLSLDTPQAEAYWQALRQNLLTKTGQHWAGLSPTDQAEVVDLTLERVRRGLPSFNYLSSLNTWIMTIWRNECYRRGEKARQRQASQITWEDAANVVAGEANPETTIGRQSAEAALWQRIRQLTGQPDTKLLRLKAKGYTLQQIHDALDDPKPALSTVSRKLNRLYKRLKNDPDLANLARDLGIDPDFEP